MAFLFLAWGGFAFVLGLPAQIQDALDLWPKVVRDPMFTYVIVWMPMLFGMIIVTLSEWDRVRKVFGFDPPRNLEMEGAIQLIYDRLGKDERFWGQLQSFLQQEARDNKVTVWARVGIFCHNQAESYAGGVYEVLTPIVFRTNGFTTNGRWVVGRSWIPGDIIYYDPMFNRAEIESLSQRLEKMETRA